MLARSTFALCLIIGTVSLGQGGEVRLAPLVKAPAPRLSPANLDGPRSTAASDTNALEAVADFDRPLVTPADEAQVKRDLMIPRLTMGRGMEAPKIEVRPLAWWEAEREAMIKADLAKEKAKRKAAQAQKNLTRARRTKARIAAIDLEANSDAAAFQQSYLQQARRGFP